MKLGSLLGAGVIALAIAAPAQATVVVDASVTADCRGYRLTINGASFLPGECRDVMYQVVITDGTNVHVAVNPSYPAFDQLCYSDGNSATPARVFSAAWPAAGSPSVPLPGVNAGYNYQPWPATLGVPYTVVATGGPERGALVLWDDTLTPATVVAGAFGPCAPPEPPVVEICRDAEFWGTHAGTEGGCRRGAGRNITLELIGKLSDRDLDVCGKILVDTDLWAADSALEGLCSLPFFDERVALARQLSATALNCAISAGRDDCAGVSIQPVFAACNDACVANGDKAKIRGCTQQLDCYNRGGLWNGTGCQVGTCNGDGRTPCGSDYDCGRSCRDRVKCVPLPDTCATRPLTNGALGVDLEPVGAPSSMGACGVAHFDFCTIFNCRRY